MTDILTPAGLAAIRDDVTRTLTRRKTTDAAQDSQVLRLSEAQAVASGVFLPVNAGIDANTPPPPRGSLHGDATHAIRSQDARKAELATELYGMLPKDVRHRLETAAAATADGATAVEAARTALAQHEQRTPKAAGDVAAWSERKAALEAALQQHERLLAVQERTYAGLQQAATFTLDVAMKTLHTRSQKHYDDALKERERLRQLSRDVVQQPFNSVVAMQHLQDAVNAVGIAAILPKT